MISDNGILEKIMTEDIPSIWIEFKDTNQTKIAIGSFYREWTHNGVKSDEEQVKNMELFCEQIEKCSNRYNNIIILGDMNLCNEKWKDILRIACLEHLLDSSSKSPMLP